MPPRNSERSRFVLVDNNFCNYPLARDQRTRQHWRRSKKTGRWWCDLPGDTRIRFWLPKDTEAAYRHCPTGFDINVLFLLLGEARKIRKDTFSLASDVAMLKVLGLGADTRNRRRLHDALRYWSMVSIGYECWYTAGEGVGRGKKVLATPIRMIDSKRRITLHPDWIILNRGHRGYWAKVELPLPHAAAAQNLVLTLVKSVNEWDDATPSFATSRKVPGFCHKIGLSHSLRRRGLHSIAKPDGAAHEWFKRRGEHLSMAPRGASEITFTIVKRAHEPVNEPIKRYRRSNTKLPRFPVTERRRERDAELAWKRELAEREQEHQEWMDRHHPGGSLHPRRAPTRRPTAPTATEQRLPQHMITNEQGRQVTNYELPDGRVVEHSQVPAKWKHLM
jgi:hypothetical protein